MGTVIGVVAYLSSSRDLTFVITIGMAQLLSILTAGLTGTMAPLIFSFVFHRDSGKWGGPLETAIQDIVGSFAMVILSYKMLMFLGPGEVLPSDICGATIA
jgi:Mg/Co/Ni transporter MgtE